MDRDLAISMKTALTNIKNILNTLATNTTPTAENNRSVSPEPVEQRTMLEAISVESEEPEPITEKK